MQLQRLTSPKSAEPMSKFESKGQQAVVEPGRTDVQFIRQEKLMF